MKKALSYTTCALLLTGITHTTNATPAATYANNITTNNISALQHTIVNTAFNNLHRNKTTNTTTIKSSNPQDIYGRAPMYGTMSQYGEYNDDGRSGGDKSNATLNNIQFTWQHNADRVKFNEFAPLDTDSDLILVNLIGNEYNIGTVKNTWGIYTGYIGATQENNQINIDEQGGYFGLANNFNIQKLNIKTTINAGALDNSVDTTNGTDDYTNFWIGAATRISYDIKLDSSLILRPEIYAGYTWIKSDDYTSASGQFINNSNTNSFEITPAINITKHVGNNWYWTLNTKYIIITNNDKNIIINNTKLKELDIGNFFEYGLTINKQFDNTDFSINIGRHDGDRYGWFGGLNMRYIF